MNPMTENNPDDERPVTCRTTVAGGHGERGASPGCFAEVDRS